MIIYVYILVLIKKDGEYNKHDIPGLLVKLVTFQYYLYSDDIYEPFSQLQEMGTEWSQR